MLPGSAVTTEQRLSTIGHPYYSVYQIRCTGPRVARLTVVLLVSVP